MENMFLKGIYMGLSISAPIGPMTFLILNAVLNQGKKNGIAAALGVTLADTSYAMLVAFGLNTIIEKLLSYSFYMDLIGGFFLLYLAYSIFFKKIDANSLSSNNHQKEPAIKLFVSSFLITISSPATLILFGALFTVFDTTTQGDTFTSGLQQVGGFFFGSMVFWLILIYLLIFFREKINIRFLKIINSVAALVFFIFACFAFYKLFNT